VKNSNKNYKSFSIIIIL